MSRSAESLLHEADYWRLALTDLLELNTLVLTASQELSQTPLEVLALTMATMQVETGDSLGRISRATSATMTTLQAIGEGVGRLVDLAGGRQKAMQVELDTLKQELDGD